MVLVTGATGYLGPFLVQRLLQEGRAVRCLVRPSSDTRALVGRGVEVHQGDLQRIDSVRAAFAGIAEVFHLAHIRFSSTVLECLGPRIRRVVMISSLRRFSQVQSASVEAVVQGEAQVLASQAPWVLLRPSMIYGPGDDRNISRLATYLHRRRWLPVCGTGRALQQPVYVEDVVQAVVAAGWAPGVVCKAYALAGPRAFPYYDLVDRVGASVGVRPILIHLPVGLVLVGLRMLKAVGVRLGVEAAQVRRLQEDKTASIAGAERDLDFVPVGFAEGLARIYGQGTNEQS